MLPQQPSIHVCLHLLGNILLALLHSQGIVLHRNTPLCRCRGRTSRVCSLLARHYACHNLLSTWLFIERAKSAARTFRIEKLKVERDLERLDKVRQPIAHYYGSLLFADLDSTKVLHHPR